MCNQQMHDRTFLYGEYGRIEVRAGQEWTKVYFSVYPLSFLFKPGVHITFSNEKNLTHAKRKNILLFVPNLRIYPSC